ncbi:MAG: c-type cytochrome [Bacteroidota bacterium]
MSEPVKAPRNKVSIPTVVLLVLLVAVVAYLVGDRYGEKKYRHISAFAWDKDEWANRTKGLRTSYNPDHDLNNETLTLVPGDERWLDFVFWCFNNKLAEHQVEAYGGTEWDGPTGGVIFHWAPGSRWETHTLASFGFTIGHTIGEHKWLDTQFPDFFEKYGGVYGINVKDRLAEIDTASPTPWVEFLQYGGGANSPYYRYLFHQEAVVDPVRDRIYLIGGQGVGFEYTFERYFHEVREVLTDARAYQFFQLYDMYGPGFASLGGWAKNTLSAKLHGIYFTDDMGKWSTKPGVAKAVKYDPNPPSPPIPAGIPEPESANRGEAVYKKQCTPCHGITGDGKGFLAAGFDVKPRDFRQGIYKFRSTKTGQFPTVADLEHIIRVGVPNSTMPAWGEFLSKDQIHDLACYLITFSDQFTESWKKGEQPELLPVPAPPEHLAALAAKGKKVFDLAQCAQCHGEKGKGDGPAAQTLTDYWESPIPATDLTYKWVFKNGYKPQDVYRTFNGGLNGTPMPSYLDAIEKDEDRWALVAYVLSLSPEKRPVLHLNEFKHRIASAIDERGIVRK